MTELQETHEQANQRRNRIGHIRKRNEKLK